MKVSGFNKHLERKVKKLKYMKEVVEDHGAEYQKQTRTYST